MFPYSLGVQAATKDKALDDLAAQVEKLAEEHPDAADTYSSHLKAVVSSAATLADLLPEDDEATDVAISAQGHLVTKRNAVNERDVQSASFTVYAGRCPVDPSKYSATEPKKSKKAKKAEEAAE